MMKYVLSLLFILFASSQLAYAASSDFHIRTFVGDDTQPPSTPASLVATPIATSQIDLSWGASTDDFVFGGYQIFRDAAQIATTTLTSYSDTGLSASTTYSYYVKAFDSFNNISSSSNIANATTLALTPTSTPTTTPTTTQSHKPGGSGPGNVKLESFVITPSLYSAEFKWQTDQYAQFELRWGRTSSYELGFVMNQLFTRSDDTLITDLQPETVYEYELIAYDKNGIKTVLSEGQFKTVNAPDTVAPANVSNLKAVVDGDSVHLSWIDPSDPDFAYVRVVRNYFFYPADPLDGFIAYQDSGTALDDLHALNDKTVQYYTVFSYDTHGNISSGAVVAAYLKQAGVSNTSTPLEISSTTASSTPIVLNLSDLQFVQNSEAVDPSQIDASLPFGVRIAYEKLPEHLKAIVVTLRKPDDPQSVFSFLLRVNNDKSYYESTIAALEQTGVYPLTLSVYDYATHESIRLQGSLTAVPHRNDVLGGAINPGKNGLTRTEASLLLILLLAVAYVIYRTFHELGFIYNKRGNIDRSKLAVSMFALFIFGGSSAYLLASIIAGRSSTFSDSPTAAAAASSGVQLLSFTPLFLLLLCVFIAVTFIAVLLNRHKEK